MGEKNRVQCHSGVNSHESFSAYCGDSLIDCGGRRRWMGGVHIPKEYLATTTYAVPVISIYAVTVKLPSAQRRRTSEASRRLPGIRPNRCAFLLRSGKIAASGNASGNSPGGNPNFFTATVYGAADKCLCNSGTGRILMWGIRRTKAQGTAGSQEALAPPGGMPGGAGGDSVMVRELRN